MYLKVLTRPLLSTAQQQQQQQSSSDVPPDAPTIRRSDLANHNTDGGMWVLQANKVYDAAAWRKANNPQAGEEEPATVKAAFEAAFQAPDSREQMDQFFIGNFVDVSMWSTEVQTCATLEDSCIIFI